MKTAELFDELLALTVSYPKTIVLLLLGRSGHFAGPASAGRCPPGAFVLLTFATIYVLGHLTPQGEAAVKLPDWLKTELALATAFAGVAVLVNVQSLILRKVVPDLRSPGALQVEAFVYPYCITLLTTAAMFFTLPMHWIPMYGLPIHGLYIWTLYTVLRGSTSLARGRACLVALLAYGSFLAIAVVVYWPFYRLHSEV
ncbi:MAG: hypothetical protein J0L57_20945 [Burkholderiales bacterium]|nr:hypothetical protein [Burkholderiales bacterium]